MNYRLKMSRRHLSETVVHAWPALAFKRIVFIIMKESSVVSYETHGHDKTDDKVMGFKVYVLDIRNYK